MGPFTRLRPLPGDAAAWEQQAGSAAGERGLWESPWCKVLGSSQALISLSPSQSERRSESRKKEKWEKEEKVQLPETCR